MADYTLSAKIVADIKDFTSKIDTVTKKLQSMSKNMGSALESIGGSISSVGKKLTGLETVAAGLATAGLAKAADTAIDFDTQMRKAAATAGISSREIENMTGDFKALRDSALELGAATSLTASEVAVAMTEMAAKGFDTNQIIGAMPGIISAAEASGEELATVSDTVTSAINAYGLSADDATHIADVMAQSANDSAASVSSLGYSFKYAAPLASSLGIDLEELAACTGLLADAGIDGETAGTTLRSMLQRLVNPTDEAKEVMDELGLSFFDSEGKMKSLSAVIEELQTATEGLTDEEKQSALATIFRTNAMTGVNALMSRGSDEIETMTEKLKACDGASEETSKKMKSGIGGSLEKMQGAIETFAIAIGTSLFPAIQTAADAIQDLFVDMTEGFNADGIAGVVDAIIAKLQELTQPELFSPISENVTTVQTTIGKVVDKVDDLWQKFQELQDAGVPFGKIAAAATAAGPALIIVGNAVSTLGSGFSGLSGILGSISSAFSGEMSSIGKWAESFVKKCKNMKTPFEELSTALGPLKTAISSLVSGGFARLSAAFSTVAALFPSITIPLIVLKTKLVAVGSGITTVFGGIAAKLGPVFTQIGTIASKFGAALSSVLKVAVSFGGQFTSVLMKAFGFGAIAGLVLVGLGLIQQNFGDKIAEILADVQEKAPQIIQAFGDKITESIPELIAQGGTLLGNLIDTLAAMMPSIVTVGSDILISLANGFSEQLPDLLQKAGNLIISIVSSLTEKLPEIMQAGMNVLSALIQGISETLPDLIPAALEMILTIAEGVVDNLPQLIDSGLMLLQAIVDGIVEALPTLAEKIPEIIMKIADVLIEKGPELLVTAAELIAQLAEGLVQAIPKLVEKIPVIFQHIKDKIMETDWLALATQILTAVGSALESVGGLLWDAVKAIFSLVSEWVSSEWESIKAKWELAIAIVSEIFSNLGESIKNIVTSIKDWISEKVEAAKETISNVVDAVSGFFSNLKETISGIFDSIADKIRSVMDTVKGIFENVLDSIENLWNGLSDFVGGIFDGIGTAFDNLISGAKSLINNFIDGLNFAIDIINAIPGVSIGYVDYLAHGTDDWSGGFAIMNEGGRGELVNLPNGSQVIPHDISKKYAQEAARVNATEVMFIDYDRLITGIASAMQGVSVNSTVNLDGKAVSKGIAPYMDTDLGRLQGAAKRYAT